MRFAMEDPRSASLLPETSTGGRSWSLLGFFFHDRGSVAQKTLRGMLQELLYQILSHIPESFPIIEVFYNRLVQDQRKSLPEWDENTLEACLYQVLDGSKYGENAPLQPAGICFFIDALDEHLGDNDRLLTVIRDLTDRLVLMPKDRLTFKICLASRPWPVFKDTFADVPQFSIHDHTRGDIASYIRDRLHKASEGRVDESIPVIRTLISTITEKALGVFIWVRIVVDEVCSGIRDGTPFFILEGLVSNMPEELEELYARALSRVQPNHVLESHVLLQLALSAVSPLSLGVLRDCTLSAIYGQMDPGADELFWLASRSGGLLEAIPFLPTHLPPLARSIGPGDHQGGDEAGNSHSRPRSAPITHPELSISTRVMTTPPNTGTSDIRHPPVEVKPQFLIQFIHQTAKEYVRRGKLGLNYTHMTSGYEVVSPIGYPVTGGRPSRFERFLPFPRTLSKTGNSLFLVAAISLDAEASENHGVFEHILDYAVAVDEEIDQGISRTEDFGALLSPSPSLQAWLKKRYGFGRIMKWETLMIFLAIASNLYNFPGGDLQNDELEPEALARAALGARLSLSRDNRLRMVQSVLAWGNPIDDFPYSEEQEILFVRDGLANKIIELVTGEPCIPRTWTHLCLLVGVKRHAEVDEKTRLALAALLLENGANPNRWISKGISILEIAARSLSVEWLRLLLSHGAKWHIDAETHEELLDRRNPTFLWYENVWDVLEDRGIGPPQLGRGRRADILLEEGGIPAEMVRAGVIGGVIGLTTVFLGRGTG